MPLGLGTSIAPTTSCDRVSITAREFDLTWPTYTRSPSGETSRLNGNSPGNAIVATITLASTSNTDSDLLCKLTT